MHKLINQIANTLFQKNDLQECSVEELKAFTNQYPYFPSLQLLYTARLKEINSSDYRKELQKTSLFFNSPHWLNELLSDDHAEEVITEKAERVEKINYEEYNNDEIVVENPRPEVFNALPELKEKIISIQKVELPQADEPALAFEPYHTVDYFASQGIKNFHEEKPTDRIGHQLRSFTEWLKTLKVSTIHENSIPSNPVDEEKVVILADHSVEDRNVVTEAMAEVWIKQGQPEKAQAIYNKLSLLNPGKSSYFANLIENLKKN